MTALQGNVLLIDDHQNLAAGVALLFDETYSIVQAHNESEAEPYLQSNKLDLIILDYQLNGSKNGVDLAEEYRNRFPRIPIIILTGYADETLIEICREKAILLFVKPVGREIREYMDCYQKQFHSASTLEAALAETNKQCGTPSTSKQIPLQDHPDLFENWYMDYKKMAEKGVRCLIKNEDEFKDFVQDAAIKIYDTNPTLAHG